MSKYFSLFHFFKNFCLTSLDPVCSLSGSASYEENHDGRTVLFLNGNNGAYAETPALPIHSTDLTVAVWIKLVKLKPYYQAIYADWLEPTKMFRFAIAPDGRLCAQTKRHGGHTIFQYCTDRYVSLGGWLLLKQPLKLTIPGSLRIAKGEFSSPYFCYN